MQPNNDNIQQNTPQPELTEDEMIDLAAAQVLQRFRTAFEELAT